jgi:sarcosine oxidase subunit alpha
MSGQSFRIRDRGRIDRQKPVRFRFDGTTYGGYEGDTLASALLANGVHLVGRSFKYHRPRGILGAGSEEPNALIQLGAGNRTEPNLRATQIEIFDGLQAESQNRWPCLKYDIGAINSVFHRLLPSGFYYKTFMWPASLWMTYEHVIRNAAGLGKAPEDRDPDRYEKMHAHADVLIVG